MSCRWCSFRDAFRLPSFLRNQAVSGDTLGSFVRLVVRILVVLLCHHQIAVLPMQSYSHKPAVSKPAVHRPGVQVITLHKQDCPWAGITHTIPMGPNQVCGPMCPVQNEETPCAQCSLNGSWIERKAGAFPREGMGPATRVKEPLKIWFTSFALPASASSHWWVSCFRS